MAQKGCNAALEGISKMTTFAEAVFPLIVNRPLKEKPSRRARCPRCKDKHLRFIDSSTTLLGGGDGTKDGDPNHVHERYQCTTCNFLFTREYQRGNVWYTLEDGTVLSGLPSCFEHYVYKCAHCGGKVVMEHRKRDGVTKTYLLGESIPSGERDYRTFYKCLTCRRSVELIHVPVPVTPSSVTSWVINPTNNLRALQSANVEKEIDEFLNRP